MTLLVTGATGFVMSVLGRYWLDAFPGERLVVLDAAAPDAAAVRYFAPGADRLGVGVADLTRPDSWRAAPRGPPISHNRFRPHTNPPSARTPLPAPRHTGASNSRTP